MVFLEGGVGRTERRTFANFLSFQERGLTFVKTDRWDGVLYQVTLREFHRPLDSRSRAGPKMRAGNKTVCGDLRCIRRGGGDASDGELGERSLRGPVTSGNRPRHATNDFHDLALGEYIKAEAERFWVQREEAIGKTVVARFIGCPSIVKVVGDRLTVLGGAEIISRWWAGVDITSTFQGRVAVVSS